MRKLILFAATIISLYSPAEAAVYAVDPRVGDVTVGPPSQCFEGCVPATSSPLYTFASGDTVDYGTLIFSSYYVSLGRPGEFVFLGYPVIDVSFGPISPFALPFIPNANIMVCDRLFQNCGLDNLPPPTLFTYHLSYVIPAGASQIQLAWNGPLIAYMPSAPEPSTWAMLLIGFAGIGFAAFRRELRSKISVGLA
jgi:hypothetical protein